MFPSINETQALITKLAESNFTGKSCEKEFDALAKSEQARKQARWEEKVANKSTVLRLGTELSHKATCIFLAKFSKFKK